MNPLPDPQSPDFVAPRLPEGWNSERDLLLFLGRGAGPRLVWARKQGIERVRIFLPKGLEDEDLPEDAPVVRSGGELVQQILGWEVGTAPSHLVLQRTSDPEITVDFQRELGRRVEGAVASHQVQSNTVMESQ